ncbi:hypothetical protein Nepgr_010751 [Nepenthes gracilis]|uniref:Uncharacterized protein n=1 Tax=Nepenthes gracilis TaxID=150966 RepID=A0AAD3XLQ3_NEPGR|nr:hypothetical protein Nepgr_010751 [Nepenthes gracilis]
MLPLVVPNYGRILSVCYFIEKKLALPLVDSTLRRLWAKWSLKRGLVNSEGSSPDLHSPSRVKIPIALGISPSAVIFTANSLALWDD